MCARFVGTLSVLAGSLALAACGSGNPASFSCASVDKPGVIGSAAKAALSDNTFASQAAAQNQVTDTHQLTAEFQRQVRDLCQKNGSDYKPFAQALENTKEYARTGNSTLSGAPSEAQPSPQISQGAGSDSTGSQGAGSGGGGSGGGQTGGPPGEGGTTGGGSTGSGGDTGTGSTGGGTTGGTTGGDTTGGGTTGGGSTGGGSTGGSTGGGTTGGSTGGGTTGGSTGGGTTGSP